MGEVSLNQGINYGLSIFGYVIGVGVVSFVAILIGIFVADASTGLGILIMFVAVVLAMAGLAGFQYKVIADAVAMGLQLHEADDFEERSRAGRAGGEDSDLGQE